MIECTPSWKAVLALLMPIYSERRASQGLELGFFLISASGAVRQGPSLVWSW